MSSIKMIKMQNMIKTERVRKSTYPVNRLAALKRAGGSALLDLEFFPLRLTVDCK